MSRSFHFSVLGGAEEIGANCTYLSFGGTGIIIDAGLHPKERDLRAFPPLDSIKYQDIDALLITHAHTDHIGGMPFLLKQHPYIGMHTTALTRDIASVMLKNTVTLIRDQIELSKEMQDAISLYDKSIIEYISTVFETHAYQESFEIYGKRSPYPVACTFHDAGHIPGSAGVMLEWNGLSVFHTGDMCLHDQWLIPKATFPKHHVDVMFCECTNGAEESHPKKEQIMKECAQFINEISNKNGSILIPCFALGKTQETLIMLHELQRKGMIPHLPIYSGGMSKAISSVFDRYCYTSPRMNPGFEISDIAIHPMPYEELSKAPFFSTPSIVLASSGMMHPQTTSHKLAMQWMQKSTCGILFNGWQEPDSPGYALSKSELGKPFLFSGHRIERKCAVKNIRMSAHARKRDVLSLIQDIRPKTLVLIHGETVSCEAIASEAMDMFNGEVKIILPMQGEIYDADGKRLSS
ncbi:MAG: MBL fold metallo-hydrolase [Candidatus Kapaibacteriota bacterium]